MTPDSETVLVAETGLGKYQVEARMGDAALLIDEPLEAGGLGSGPNPYDLISAAVGACTTMTVRLYANRKGWPLTRVRAPSSSRMTYSALRGIVASCRCAKASLPPNRAGAFPPTCSSSVPTGSMR